MELWLWHFRIPFHFSQFQKFFFYPLFWQCHCHNCQKFIPSILAMPLLQTIFFFLPFLAMALPQLPNFFFSHHLVFLARTHTLSTHSGNRYGQKELVLPKIKNFSLLLFISLSPTFVEFRQ